MREVKELASGMKEAIAGLKRDAVDAKSALLAEVDRAKVNSGKVRSVATELKEANLEVEEFLGETGSNFPSSEESPRPPVTGDPPAPPRKMEAPRRTDINGVTLNEGSA